MHVHISLPWFADIANYLVTKTFPHDMLKSRRDKLIFNFRSYVWDDPYLWKFYSDLVIRRCIPEHEHHHILAHCHAYACGGHFDS